MFRALHSSATGMQAQQTQIDIIANNLANVNTVGFKKSRGEFQDLYYQQLRTPAVDQTTGTSDPIGLEIGTGVRVMASQKDFNSGDMIQTGNSLDLAIEGNGFFRVVLPDGQNAFTRAGNLRINERGQVVNVNGYALDPPIEIPSDTTDITVSREGAINVRRGGETESIQIGEVQLVLFGNPAGLQLLVI